MKLNQGELFKILLEKTKISAEDADRLSHSLTDISESFDKIYNQIIPKIINETNKELTVELFWDIREQFRHIDYHIKDAELTELFYVKG